MISLKFSDVLQNENVVIKATMFSGPENIEERAGLISVEVGDEFRRTVATTFENLERDIGALIQAIREEVEVEKGKKSDPEVEKEVDNTDDIDDEMDLF